MNKKSLSEVLQETAEGLHRAGLMNDETMRELEIRS